MQHEIAKNTILNSLRQESRGFRYSNQRHSNVCSFENTLLKIYKIQVSPQKLHTLYKRFLEYLKKIKENSFYDYLLQKKKK